MNMNKILKITLIAADVLIGLFALWVALTWNSPRISTLRRRLCADWKTSVVETKIKAHAKSTLRSNLDENVEAACLMLMDVKSGEIFVKLNLSRSEDGDFIEGANCVSEQQYEPGAVIGPIVEAISAQTGKRFDRAILSGYSWRVSPMNLLNYYNAVARGSIMEESLTATINGESYELTITYDLYEEISGILKENCDSMEVFYGAKCHIAGKSGVSYLWLEDTDSYSDEDNRHKYVSTFAGFFPPEKPRCSVVCVVLTGFSDGRPRCLSAPEKIVRELIDASM